MNKIILHGRLTRDPETRQAGTSTVCKFSVAENYGKNRENANFHDCEAWNKGGEFVQKYFKRGQEIVIVGELQQREYDAKDGTKRRATTIRVEQSEFCGKASDKCEEQPIPSLPNDDKLPW